MQAILVLYFADTVAHGGMGMVAGTAASVSAAYGTLVYLVSVAGGWLADRILGSYRAVLWGGILIACGHYAMAVPTAAHDLGRPRPDQRGHGAAQAQRRHHGRQALPHRRRPP